MKVRASVKRLCESCKIVRRKNVVRVICKNPVTNRDRVESSRFQTGNPKSKFLNIMPRLSE